MLKPVVPGDEKGREGGREGVDILGTWVRRRRDVCREPQERGARVLLGWWRLAG